MLFELLKVIIIILRMSLFPVWLFLFPIFSIQSYFPFTYLWFQSLFFAALAALITFLLSRYQVYYRNHYFIIKQQRVIALVDSPFRLFLLQFFSLLPFFIDPLVCDKNIFFYLNYRNYSLGLLTYLECNIY